jgi:hypothetical protein
MLKRIPWWVKALIIVAALFWAATYNQPATPAAPATPPASTPAQDTAAPDCFHVPADGQSHPCDIPAPR